MSERTQSREDHLLNPKPQLEGGQGGETVVALGFRDKLKALASTALAVTISLSPRSINAAEFQTPSELTLDKTQVSPEASGSGSAPIDKHCDEIDGQKRFSGLVENGVLRQHNFRGKAYAKAYEEKMYLCFEVPADEGKPYPHWTARYIGPENWFTGSRKVTSRDLNNCPTVNPCN